ncbi:uncharacterized protein LOC106013449 [Aplysia californica]|uniref:Uncharacterized protein LOC106013449 n=1 Tax=Aplysia californica TaxID=6500 RepID=A0ABM1ABU2_APLCA|nr:uncharacterized protein LOC106013449 [Aplysia californica]
MVIKFQSYDAIHHFLNVQGHSTNRGNATCRQLNELAISVAFNSSTPAAQRRYKTSGRPILLADDKNMHNGISFDTTSLTLNEQDDGLHVQSVAMKLSTDSPLFPGVFDCKLLSPYRAMEWMNVDSLRAKKPAGDLTLWTQM